MPPVTEEDLKKQQLALIASLLYSTSSVKVHHAYGEQQAAEALYNKGMRVDVEACRKHMGI